MIAARPWDLPFEAKEQEIQREASNLAPGNASIVLLLDEYRFKIDSQRRSATIHRRVFRVVNADDADHWSSVEQSYEPWHEERPVLRARVIANGGNAHWLDPKTIDDAPAREYESSIFSDRRVIRAPLPAFADGAVVEFEVTVRDLPSVLDAGISRRIVIDDTIPTERFSLRIEAAAGVPLRIASQRLPAAALTRQDGGGATTVTCEYSALKARENVEYSLPSDVSSFPYVAFSTGPSWQSIAARYAAIVDQQLAGADVSGFIRGISLEGTPVEVATRLAERLHGDIRYTGVEFGEAAIVPRKPAEVLARKYGDCKDKAALLLAMLRSANLKANVALLSAGHGLDVDQELPGLGQFDHVIVRVDSTPPLWIDATAADTRIGDLPDADRDRLALIASPSTTGLIRTPPKQSRLNRRVHTVEMSMGENGPGRIREIIEATGEEESNLRQIYSGDDKKVRESLERFVKRDYLAKLLGKFEVPKKGDFGAAFRLSVEAIDASRATTAQEDAAAAVFPHLVLQDLPHLLTAEDDERQPARQGDFVFPKPFQIEYRYKIRPPNLFQLKELPRSEEIEMGPAKYSRSFRKNDDGSIDAVFRFDSGKPRISAAEFAQLREKVRGRQAGLPELVIFTPVTTEALALGDYATALKYVREFVDANPSSVMGQVRLSRTLVSAGMRDLAIAAAKKATELDARSSAAWQALGWAYEHDQFGRRLRADWNPVEAEKALREAVKSAPDDVVAMAELAILLEHDSKGNRYGPTARLAEAIAIYRQAIKKQASPGLEQNLAAALLYAHDFDGVREQSNKLEAGLKKIYLATATAISSGAAKAIVEVQGAFVDNASRAQALISVAGNLIPLRHYDRAVDILKAAARLGGPPEILGRIQLFSKFKRVEDTLLPEPDPAYPVQALLHRLFTTELKRENLSDLFTRLESWDDFDSGTEQIRRGMGVFGELTKLGFSAANVVDLIVGGLTIVKEGDEKRGYRVVAVLEGSSFTCYVVRESGRWKILAASDSTENAGKLILEFVKHNDLDAARWWLDHIITDVAGEKSVAGMPASRILWSGITKETRGANDIRIAAASLMGRHSVSQEAIDILETERTKKATILPAGVIDLALCETYNKAQRWSNLATAARRLMAVKSYAEEGAHYYLAALSGGKRWKELQAEAERQLKSHPDDLRIMKSLASALIHNGSREKAASWLLKITKAPGATSADELFEAWNSLLLGKPSGETLTALVSKVQNPMQATADQWYTVAIVEVMLKRPTDALQSLRRALDRDSVVDARSWVVFGEIAKQFGYADLGRQMLSRAAGTPSTRSETAYWAAELATKLFTN